MPICITCSTPVKNLYTVYSKADDRTLGKGVRLTQCPNCKHFADKYVEHDFVVLFIDLVLIKPQVYRHLLFNRLGRSDDKFDPSILRLGVLLVLFDVYITWARIERSSAAAGGTDGGFRLAEMPILTQYLFFLTMNVLATIAQHGTIRMLVRHLLAHTQKQEGSNDTKSPVSASIADLTLGPPAGTVNYASPSAISTALLVSSCTKLFPILLVIWPTEAKEGDSFGFAFRATNYVGWAVLLNNIEALLVLLNCGYIVATGLAVSGVLARWVVEGWVLSLLGLGRETGPVGDLLAACKLIRGWLTQI
ncbi:hypothetical protein A1O3_07241 [Capronia epimyces CBS 606.96]|uniref:Protein ARV n=1 Tax=Capronia epimyces CBS 606.96 TaxID=1182542 RepID=W9XL92_9EURO|nr:uncharacterized protein A1O3_07241 [Capronia epimyces CBS 606.96]EXJ80953.1 hypothetical protein A1O3_07241 [Capronia epimyces CBS 606.96]